MQTSEEEVEKARQELQEQMVRGFASENVNDKVIKIMDYSFEEFKKCKERRFIRKTDDNYPYPIIKKAMRSMYDDEKTMNFLINRNKVVKGKITNLVEDGIVEIPLVIKASRIEKDRYKKDEARVTKLFFFGERVTNEWTQEEILSSKFYVYRMVCNDEGNMESYHLLSDSKLNLEDYEIEGMELELDDFSDISKYAKLMKKNHIMIVNIAKPSRIVFKNHDEMFNKIKPYLQDKQNFFKYLFSIKLEGKRIYFPHPSYFENLVSAFTLGAKYDSSPYPVHLLVIGKQGGGKSKAQEALFEKLNEIVPIVEGAGSTMKSLIPSFNGQLTKAGALIEANRICFVDEFFRILMRVDKDERENQLTHLNPLLEHKQRRFGSGNNYLDGKMTAKLFAVTNPVFGTSTMQVLCNKLDNSFISRVLVWYQDEDHYKQVTSKNENDLEIIEDSFPSDLFLSIYDHCNSFKSIFDIKRVMEIYNKNKDLISDMYENVQAVYSSRYKHHIVCLIDGLIKVRCICELDNSFVAKEEDYKLLDLIWERMLVGWKVGILNDKFNYGHNKEERFYGN